MARRVSEHQELGQEIEVGQPSCHQLEIPGVALALLPGDERSHLEHGGRNLGRLALPPQDLLDRALRPARQPRRRQHLARHVVDHAREIADGTVLVDKARLLRASGAEA